MPLGSITELTSPSSEPPADCHSLALAPTVRTTTKRNIRALRSEGLVLTALHAPGAVYAKAQTE